MHYRCEKLSTIIGWVYMLYTYKNIIRYYNLDLFFVLIQLNKITCSAKISTTALLLLFAVLSGI